MLRIRCVVERITYQNPDNGYSVLKVAVKGYDDLVTVVGNLLDASVGSVLLIEGNWKDDSKYGRQFCAETWEEVKLSHSAQCGSPARCRTNYRAVWHDVLFALSCSAFSAVRAVSL